VKPGATETTGLTVDELPLFQTRAAGLSAMAVAPRGSGVLAVVFSQVRVPEGRFGLSRLFARTRHACLFLNQPENDWYRGTDAAVDAAIERAVRETGTARIVLYGSSMGASGAIRTAARWPQAEAVVFAPDWRIGEAGSQSAVAGLAEKAGEPDLPGWLAGPRTGRVTIAFGLFDAYDAGVAARLAAAPLPEAVQGVPLASSHEVHDHLYTVNVIRRVISGFTRDLGAEAASRGLRMDGVDFAAYARFAELAAAASGGGVTAADVDALGLAGNPGAALLAAMLEERAGALDAAEARLALLQGETEQVPSLASLPKRYLKDIPRRRIALLGALGRVDEARRVAALAAAAYPSDAGFAVAAGLAAPVE
jgi:hypothetical protein